MSTPAQDRTHFHVEVELIAASKDLGFAAVRVYMALAERCYGPYGERYKAWPSLETLRDETKLHRATVVKAITTLVEKGWLMHAGTSSVKTNVYLLVKRAPPEAIQQAAIVAHRRRSNRRAQATGQSSSTGDGNRNKESHNQLDKRTRTPLAPQGALALGGNGGNELLYPSGLRNRPCRTRRKWTVASCIRHTVTCPRIC